MLKRKGLVLVAVACAVMLGGCFLFQNRPPDAAFVVIYDVDPEDPMVVDLDATSSSDPDGDAIVEYSWTFGDDVAILTPLDVSKRVETPILRIRYPVEGTYNVSLLVRDALGNPSEIVSGTVIVPNVPVGPTD